MEFIFFATDLRLKVKMTPLLLILLVACSNALSSHREMALMNVTRFASGDLFSLIGTDCGLTRCMEVSHGTALAALGSISCVCQCGRDTPTFREDQRICVNHILECPMASYGRGSTKPQIPFVFLPLKGQIIYPAKEIIFTDVEDAICAVTSAQYLSPTGWVTLRDLVDNDVPFGLYRDEGSTYLQWRGSATLHARLEGRLVAVHVLCSASKPAYLATSCAAFRIAGSSRNADVRSIPFHAGELVTTEPATTGHGLSVLESVAIGVCVLLLVFVYAAGILFYVHYKQRLKRKYKDPELNISNTISTDGTTFESRMNMGSTVMGNIQDNVTFKKKDITNIHTQFQRIKNNPLLNLDGMRNDFVNDAGLSDVSEQTEDTLDSTPNSQKSRNSNIVSAMIHARHKKLVRPRATSTPDRISERLQRRSASPEIEKAPHSELSILDCSLDVKAIESLPAEPDGEPRRKLYFNPVFFETEHLKNPPPAAIEFLLKLREIMLIAKEKMVSKRFVPMLSDIPEEELYHSLDLGWDIPCARRGRRFSAISLKRENSRRAVHCGGCPGCDSVVRSANTNGLTRSNSCKTCASDEYKQKIVQKWLDDVPPPHAKKPVKSIAKVSGTPRVIEPKDKEVESRPNITQPQPMAVEDTMKISESFVKEFFNETRLKDFAKMEAQNTVKISNSKTQTKTNKDNLLLSQKVTSMNGRQIPSNHATRRVRKKLPPPPPPPTSPPLSPTSPPPSILQQTPPPVPQQTPPPIPQQPPAQNPINEKESEPVPTEVKQKMKAVISELNKCKRVESEEIYANDNIIKSVASPKLIISVSAPDSQYYSDDNLLLNGRNNSELYQNTSDFDSLERMQLKKRRFSLAYPTEVCEKNDLHNPPNMKMTRDKLTSSWRDIRKMRNDDYVKLKTKQSLTAAYVENYNITNNFSNEPLYNNVKEPGPLTIKVTGSPVYDRNNIVDDFDPDTLDRKPKKPLYDEYNERKKCVEKILLKSGGSFKYKIPTYENKTRNSPPEGVFTRKIGSLRQIYEAKAKVQETDRRLFGQRRGSVPTVSHEVAAYVKKFELSRNEDLKPPLPPKQKRITEDFSIKTNSTRGSPNSDRQRSSEERDRFSPCIRSDVSTRRSGRRSIRTRPRRIDIKKLFRTEDSGYLSTDSNESKRKTRYMIQMRPKLIPPVTFPKPTSQTKLASLHIESDTDDLESLCDGRSESGGESIETDSVFFGNFNESKRMLEELRIDEYPTVTPYRNDEYLQYRDINIILSGDSDSEHKSVISIIAGRDGRASAASVTNLDETPYINSIQC